MRPTISPVTAFAFAALLVSPAGAAGDVAAGKALALEHCARCHDVGPDGAFKTYPPSFASIAVFRSEEQIRARITFPPLHVAMPDFGYAITHDEIVNLTAYIMSLEK